MSLAASTLINKSFSSAIVKVGGLITFSSFMQSMIRIRHESFGQARSKRGIPRREGIYCKTLKKILENSEPPGYRISPALSQRLAPTHSTQQI